MALTLYDYGMAPSPRRARMLLIEKAVPFDRVIVDLAAGEQLGEAYRAINPACTVPALGLEDGILLTDNAAIAAYLEAAYPTPAMMGVTPVERAAVASWAWAAEMEGLMAIAEAMRNSAPAMKGRALPGPIDYPQIPALAERGMLRLAAFFAKLDKRLMGRDFLAINEFSLADLVAYIAVDFARVVRVKPSPEQANLIRWRDAIALRPSASA